jgi:hypothetical protein
MRIRLSTICLMSMFLIGLFSPLVHAQADSESSRATLKGISAVAVIVDLGSPEGAKKLGLSADTVQTDVELKLRLGGVRVVTQDEAQKLPGGPFLHVEIDLTRDAAAAGIQVNLCQDAWLERVTIIDVGAATWGTGGVEANPAAENIRDMVKDCVDRFLNAWLSVNPKK